MRIWMLRAARLAVVFLLFASGAAVPGQAIGAPGDTELISITASGARSGEARALQESISADGRYVLYWSRYKLYVRDRQANTTELVSVGSTGNPVDEPQMQAISPNGRYVVFVDPGANVVPNDTNDALDVFVRDRWLKTTELISVSSTGARGNAASFYPAISADGRFVAFTSLATNLIVADKSSLEDVYVRDRELGTTRLISVDTSGQASNGQSYMPAISDDGRYVAFQSTASDLVPADTNGQLDVFVRDRVGGVTERASVASNGRQGGRHSGYASISGDGRYVAFLSLSALVSPDTNNLYDVYVHDRETHQTERIVAASKLAATYGPHPGLSQDGRYVAFFSESPDIVSGDTNNTGDIFVRDRQTGTTELASVDSNGVQANRHSDHPSLSADGRYVAFASHNTNWKPLEGLAGYGEMWLHEGGEAATTPYAFTLKPGDLAFGSRALLTSTTESFWLKNKGTTALPVQGVSLRGTDASQFSISSSCGATLAVAAGCAIRVTFRPTSVGDKVATLRLVAGDERVRTRPLTGTGVD
jgi:Tol biopolymer transport system component